MRRILNFTITDSSPIPTNLNSISCCQSGESGVTGHQSNFCPLLRRNQCFWPGTIETTITIADDPSIVVGSASGWSSFEGTRDGRISRGRWEGYETQAADRDGDGLF